MLTESELEDLRADMLDLLPSTCTIQRPTTTNVKGKTTATWTNAATGVACRVDPLRLQTASTVAEQERGITRWMLTVAYNADVQDGDRIVFDSDTYEILQLHDDHSLRAVRRATLGRIEA